MFAYAYVCMSDCRGVSMVCGHNIGIVCEARNVLWRCDDREISRHYQLDLKGKGR